MNWSLGHVIGTASIKRWLPGALSARTEPEEFGLGSTRFVEDVSMLLVEPGHERQDGRLRTLRRIGTMTENGSEVVLDGNAAAGLLQEIFVREVTTAQIECAACGFTAALGSLRLYAMPVGAVLRCTHCDGVVMTAVHTPYAHWLEMTGARCLRF
jgi:hypothetical protein